jgi:hypothetical protein
MRTDMPSAGELALVIGRALPDVEPADVGRAADAVLELVLERKRAAQNRRKRAERDRRRTRAAA